MYIYHALINAWVIPKLFLADHNTLKKKKKKKKKSIKKQQQSKRAAEKSWLK